MLLESTLVRTSLSCMLSVDKRIIFLSILRTMSKGYFYIFIFQMNNRIQALRSHIVIQQILQTVTAYNAVAVIIYR